MIVLESFILAVRLHNILHCILETLRVDLSSKRTTLGQFRDYARGDNLMSEVQTRIITHFMYFPVELTNIAELHLFIKFDNWIPVPGPPIFTQRFL